MRGQHPFHPGTHFDRRYFSHFKIKLATVFKYLIFEKLKSIQNNIIIIFFEFRLIQYLLYRFNVIAVT